MFALDDRFNRHDDRLGRVADRGAPAADLRLGAEIAPNFADFFAENCEPLLAVAQQGPQGLLLSLEPRDFLLDGNFF